MILDILFILGFCILFLWLSSAGAGHMMLIMLCVFKVKCLTAKHYQEFLHHTFSDGAIAIKCCLILSIHLSATNSYPFQIPQCNFDVVLLSRKMFTVSCMWFSSRHCTVLYLHIYVCFAFNHKKYYAYM